MRTFIQIALLLAVVASGAAILVARPDRALRVGTGTIAHTLCSEIFVAGLDPQQSFREIFGSMPGIRRIPLLHHEVDTTKKEVRVTVAGRFESRAVYQEGAGCGIVYRGGAGPRPVLATRDEAPLTGGVDIAGSSLVEPADAKLWAALDRAFAEPSGAPPRGTKAVVALYNGRIVAERYAPGCSMDTRFLGWSMTKSVVNALVGILVQQGRLSLAGPAPVSAWGDPSDPRHAISIEQLMRMTSGLALDETNTGFDPSSRMLYTEPDMAAFAESARLQAPPGTRYHYSSPSTLILSRIVRDAVGGRAEDVRRFAERALFRPLGMRGVVLEFDAAGTPVGSSYMYATARDWARFGLLYANDGMADGRRILPEGWVGYSATPTPGSRDGYGAGFFTNRGESDFGQLRVLGGMPADSFFASGTQGQRIVVAPDERLVVVRLGRSQDWETFDIRGLIRLVADVNAAVNGSPR